MPDYRAVRKASRLAVEIETADGVRFTLDSDSTRSEDRPVQISFRTQRGDGFADGSMTLRRSVLKDYPDLSLLNTVRFIGADGTIAYEARLGGIAREVSSDGHSITLPLQGFMASAKARRFREVYIDRSVQRWLNPPSIARVKALLAGATKYITANGSADQQFDASGNPSIRLQRSRIVQTATQQAIDETWYYANGVSLGGLGGTHSDKDNSNTALSAGGGFGTYGVLSSDDQGTAGEATANLAGTSAPFTLAAAGTRKYACFRRLYTGGAGTFDGEWNSWFSNPYVYGTHGLTIASGGLTVSQMIKDSASRFAPKLDTTNVQDTTYPVQQAETIEPAFPYDFWTQLNQLHLWELSVWEDRSLYFQPPATMDGYDWQVRTDDPGVSLSFGGDSVTDLYNGIEVSFTDLYTQKPKRITPDDYPSDLADTDPDNPATRAGEPRWYPYDLAFPVTETDAVQYGRAQLSEAIRAKSPVTITAGFYVRDRAGNQQPAWKVRAGERIAITDHPNDAPRRIIDTNYTHDGRGLTISADRASSHLAAVIDRISLARTTAGLS